MTLNADGGTRDGYEKDWERRPEGRFMYPCGNSRVDKVHEMLDSGQCLLDIGCGEGQLLALVGGKVPFRIGADISIEALRRAKNWGCAVQFDLETGNLPFRSAAVDLVACLDVLEHLYDPRILIREISRVLTPHGVCYLSVPNARYLIRIKELILGRFPIVRDGSEFYDAGHLHSFASKNIAELADETGLVMEAVEGIESAGLRQWKVILLKAILPTRLQTEFLSIGIVMRLRKAHRDFTHAE